MANIPGTILASMISPGDTIATFPTHEDLYGKGGLIALTSLSALSSIPLDRQKVGMLFYVDETSSYYKLTSINDPLTSGYILFQDALSLSNLNYLPLSGGTVDGDVSILSSLEVGYGNTILFVSGDKVGINTENPNVELTVIGSISSNNIIYDKSGNSEQWNSTYTTFNTNSASYITNASSAVIIAKSGDDLIAKYTEAAALTPNGYAKTATNRASLIIFPAEYSTYGEPVFDEEFVDVIALGSSEKKPSVFIEDSSIDVTADDVRVVGISTKGQPFNVSGGPLQVFENCSGGNNSFGYSPDVSSGVHLQGTYINCTAGNNSFCHMVGGNDASIAGTLINCSAGDYSFGFSGGGGTLEVIGNIKNCTAGHSSFMGGETISIYINCTAGDNSFGNICKGTYIDCTAGDYSFGQQDGIASGTFINCTAESASFASNAGNASGTFKGCKGVNGCFGGSGGYASGTFIDCIAESDSFGGAYIEPSGPHAFPIAEASGNFTNCTAGGNSFGGVGGTASGVFTNCIAGDSSFGSDEGTATGKFYNCRTASFGNLTAPDIGFAVQQNCSDDSGNIIEGYISA
jgi:hypothetical protein